MELDPNHLLGDLEALLNHYDRPVDPNSLAKETDHLTPEYHSWLTPVQFAILSTAGANGIDSSPRGDNEPLFQIEDNRTLLMPDWRGNNRIDTLRNLVSIPAIGIICLIPGTGEALRIGGSARISTDPSLLARFQRDGREPRSVIVIDINRVYFQCARSIRRSGLWDGKFPEAGSIPTAGQMTKGGNPDFDAKSYDDGLAERQIKTLYSN